MSRCGSCPAYDCGVFGIHCSGDYGVEECSDTLQELYYSMQNELDKLTKPDTIRKALADWRPELDHIIDKLGTPELLAQLAQLAEEAAELGKAALKLRRALDGKNPTPVSPADALRNVQEEMADVLLCVLSVGLDEESAERTIRAKIPRWSGRIDHDPDSDCPGYDRGFHDDAGGYHEGGCGWDPNGKFCGECSCGDCGQCPVWARDTTPGGDDDAE